MAETSCADMAKKNLILMLAPCLLYSTVTFATGPSGPSAAGIQFPAQLAAAAGGGGFLVVQSTAQNNLTGFSNVKAFQSNTTAGNLIYGACSTFSNGSDSSISSIADTGLNTYVVVHSSTNAGDGRLALFEFYAKNIAGGADTVTVTFDVGTNGNACGYLEISGPSTTAPIETDNAKTGNNTKAGTGPMKLTSGKMVVGAYGTLDAQEIFVPDTNSTRHVFIPDGSAGVNLAVQTWGSTSTVTGAAPASTSTINTGQWVGMGVLLK